MNAQPSPIHIPDIPANLTPEQRDALALEFQRLALEFQRLAVVVSSGHAARLAAAEEAAEARHQALMKASQARHDATHGPLTLGDFAHATLSRAPFGLEPATLQAEVLKLWGVAQVLAAMGGQGAPALPAPTLPPQGPPMLLSDEQAAWYLSELRDEFSRHGWPATLQGAKDHWAVHGRRQGRKWVPDAPPPAWGPRAEAAPPGTKL
jgi:hypothetical protein